MAVPLVVIGAVAIAIGLIAVVVVVGVPYFSPGIAGILGQPENEQQELRISQEVRSGSNGFRQVNVLVNGVVLVADIAATDEQMTRGLSVKDSLNENEAMLFVFDEEGEHTFVMKNMKFPIDIIWIDADKTVVHIEHNLQPCSSGLFCPTYKPNDDSLYVLETVGGFAERHDVVKGTMVEFELTA
jgi:uncharacterized membrane protein (UPF0127 family)